MYVSINLCVYVAYGMMVLVLIKVKHRRSYSNVFWEMSPDAHSLKALSLSAATVGGSGNLRS